MTTDMSTDTTDRRTGNGHLPARPLWVPANFRVLAVAPDASEPTPVAPDAEPVRTGVHEASADTPPKVRRARPWDGWPTNVRLAVVGTCVVLSACWAVSANSIVDGAMAAGTPFLLALLCPLIVDGEMAIGTLGLVSISRTARGRTRAYLGFLIVLSVVVSMAANMAHPWTGWLVANNKPMPGPWSYLASGVASLWIALVVHQLVILWRHTDRPRAGEPVVDTLSVPPPASYYGTRSADGQWWWDGGQWRPVGPPSVESVALAIPHRPMPVSLSELRAPVSVDTAPAAADAERVATLVAELTNRAADGWTPSAVPKNALSRATGIPRTTLGRHLSAALSALSALEASA